MGVDEKPKYVEKWVKGSRNLGKLYVYNREIIGPVRASHAASEELPVLDLSEDYLKTAGIVAQAHALFASRRLAETLR